MKRFGKPIFIVLTICMVLGLMPASVFAESNNSYKYSITPDSQDWAKHKSYELVQLTDIPENIVKDMDTPTLVSTVMDYPFLGDIYAFDNAGIGIQVISERFSGLRELLRRSDAGDGLYKEYVTMKQEVTGIKNAKSLNFETIMKHRIIGTLLSQPVIFNQLDKVQVDSIIETSSAISKKINIEPIYNDDKSPFSEAARAYQTTYVYTPNNSAVQVLIRGEELDPITKSNMNDYMDSRYPNATRLRSATTMYNCHSYAWYSQSSSNQYWMNDPSLYMSDGSYTNVGFTPTAVGQKMYYPVSGGHSAVVYTPNSNIWNVVLTSKWGQYGLYRHKYGDDPYASGVLNITCWRRP